MPLKWFPSPWFFFSVREMFPLTLIPSLSCTIPSSQADERYRKNIQGSPQTAPPPKQPPLPPRSSEPFSNGGSASEASAMHRPMEPQVTPPFSSFLLSVSSSLAAGFVPSYSFCSETFGRVESDSINQATSLVSVYTDRIERNEQVFYCVWVNCPF